MAKEYAKIPWTMEETIENMVEVKELLKTNARKVNLDGKGKEDAKEIDFDFDRAIEALKYRIPKKPKTLGDVHVCECGLVLQIGNVRKALYYCHNCGQAIDWEGVDGSTE